MNIGIIGCGNRISVFWKTLKRMDHDNKMNLVAITNPHKETAIQRLEDKGISTEGINFYTDAEKMFENEKLDGVLIGTRCSSHAEYARMTLSRNIPLFLEKPVVTTEESLAMLEREGMHMNDKVVVSFPLRLAPVVQLAKEIIDSGRLGTVTQVQAFNNVPYGGVYYHGWYRDENETGGLFLQKASHDLDYVNYLVGETPVELCAMESKMVFKGDMPEGLYCKDCEKKNTCLEGPFYMDQIRHDNPMGEQCSFAKDTGNMDSGSVIVRYESGIHATYTQNFVARKKAASRGARVIGYKATLEFDWYTDELIVYDHINDINTKYQIGMKDVFHWGGDEKLATNFIGVVEGAQISEANLYDGLLSAKMCLRAKESSAESAFKKI